MIPRLVICLALPMLAACTDLASAPPAPVSPAPDRPMDEVPVQQRLANGDRTYGFDNGCIITLDPTRAVVKAEDAFCELYQRDIALLYASAD